MEDNADVADAKKAIIAKLKLDVAPNLVRLFREKDGAATGDALDSRMKLDTVGISEGTSLVVEVSSTAAQTIPSAPGALREESDRGGSYGGR